MKKNKKGFTLLETLIVSTFIASTLIYLFIQISNIKSSYDITFRYDTVPGLYGAQNVLSFLNKNTYDDVKVAVENSELNYVDLTDGTALSNGSNLYYKDLIQKLNIKMIIMIKEDTTDILSNLNQITSFSEEMKKFIKRIDSSKSEGLYRLVIEYNDNTFATIKIGDAQKDILDGITAKDIYYDNTKSGLKSETVQDALVEIYQILKDGEAA